MRLRLSSAEVKTLFEQISNWGKWGKDDQLGALNYITDEKRLAAARLVQAGKTVSLALPLATTAAPDNPSPVVHLMTGAGVNALARGVGGSADYFAVFPHGQAVTHVDALCHIFWQGKMYNGFDAGEVRFHGTRKCAIDVISCGVVGRGVLLDLPSTKGRDWLEPAEAVFPEDLDAAERSHRVTVQEGDVLLIRVGRARRRRTMGAWAPRQGALVDLPGLDASCLSWLHDRRIAVLGSDGTSDVNPSGYDDIPVPIHIGAIACMGVHLIDNCDFEELSATCGRLGRYEFQFMMAPLVLRRGTGCPVNPIAVF